ncbi:MAG TPA: T9SS type A sorting domain-containing protein [Ignavibacteriaceae bacterium]|nr:T9SS type A sorting domain-containing protein [Ignavibacteriaceae bacterium]
MKKKKYSILLFILPVIFLFFSSNLYPQGENPRVDHLTQEMIQSYVPEEIELAVVTVDGFDNYFLGVDFAEPHMSVNPNEPLQYFNAFNINGAHRTYDGHDWINSTPSFGTSVQGDPVTAYDSLGNLYYMQMIGNITNAKVIRSTDNGQTWTAGANAVSGGDKCWMAADQTSGPYANYVYATMTNTSFSGQNFARTTNQGATWQTTFSTSGSPLPGAMVCVGANVIGGDVPGGCVYFVTNEGNSFGPTYRLYCSTDGGATFTLKSPNNFANYVGSDVGGRNSVQNMRTRPYPFIAADNSYGPFRGRLYLVYASNAPAGNGNKPDIFCRYSTDQGATWSTPVVINDDPAPTTHNQWHPSIWCDKETGRFYAKWMDTRDVPTSDSAYIYASYSDDGGITWAPNQRISNVKMKINCTTCGGGGTPRYQGDYDAITSAGDISMIVWTDFRTGSFGSYTGYFPDFAMLVTPITNSVGNTDDQTDYTIDVPAVKLYNNVSQFTAEVTPAPATGSFDVTFTPGNTISSYPDSITMTIHTVGTVPNGTYIVNVQGTGINGIPVHRRTVTLEVIDNVPVELTSFTADVKHNIVILGWQTATEINNSGFEIQRCFQSENGRTSWEKIGFVQGNGTTTSINRYSFTDNNIVKQGHYNYRLKQIDLDGRYAYSTEASADVSKPNVYYLSQNYPNPFNPTTNIEFSIPERSHVTLKVYDILGNEVATLVNGWMESTNHQVTFNASNLASGIYYYTLMTGNFTATKKLILLK